MTNQRARSQHHRSLRILGSLTAAFALTVGSTTTAAHADDPVPPRSYAQLVNPFVGTSSEGNAYPGPTMPFGMVQLSPDNANSYQNTSYNPNTNWVWGFSHRHVNSAGCPAAGEMLVTPTTTATPNTSRAQVNKKSGGTQSAHAGYYSVELANDVTAELTSTLRTGVHRYTFPETTTANVSINVGQTLRDAGGSSVTWVDNSTVEGWVENGGFCGGTSKKQKIFFSAQFDRTAASTGAWGTNSQYQPDATESVVTSGNNGAVAVFDTTSDQDVELAVGISFVDVAGARANRLAETQQGDLSFDEARSQAESAWNEQLSRVDITASEDAKIIFYTQLYKALLSPTTGSDTDGRYLGMDQQIHQTDGWTYYQTFSLWDTYRTQATLHGLLERERATDIVRSMYQHRIEGGWLPRWSLGSLETNIMAGDPVSAWLAENFALGTVPDDIADELWDYLVENADTSPPAGVESVGRQSAEFYIANQHIPYYGENEPGLGQQFEEYRHGGSSSMEFAISDAAIGAAAQRLGKDADAARYLDRGRYWQRLWNQDVSLSGGFTGIVNAVRPDGSFVPVTNELESVQLSGFHEGTQWQYQWMANQDFAGLHEKMGGLGQFLERLDFYFAMDTLLASPGVSPSHWAPGGSSYYTSIGYNPGNEPTIMNPWLYSSAGKPAAVNDVLAANLNRFPNTPGGGVGNDDLGTMASWYVMATLGFEPVVPGSGMFALNAPRIEAATITLDGGNTIDISAPGAHESLPRYIAGLKLNGVEHTRTWFDLDDIQRGGSLDFTLTADRDTDWGTASADWLPSVAAPISVTPDVSTVAAQFPATVAATRPLGTVTFSTDGDVEAAEVPVHAEIEIDGDTYPVSVAAGSNGWDLSLTAILPRAGSFTGTLTVTAADTPRFAPLAFEPVIAELPIAVTAKPDEPAPVIITAPKITGTPTVGSLLAATPGTWSVDNLAFSYQWLRAGKPIKGATKASYKLVKADAGRKIRVRVTATKVGYVGRIVTSSPIKVTRFRAKVKVKVKTPSRIRVAKRAKVTIKVTAAIARPVGRITVRVGGNKVTKRLKANRKGKITVTLPRLNRTGKFRGKAVFKPTGKTAKRTAKSKTARFTVRVR